MHFVGADADFGTQSKFSAIVESCTGVYHDRGAIHLRCELLNRRVIRRDKLRRYARTRSC